MPTSRPSPQNPYVPAITRSRVRWDNLMIGGVGLIVAIAAVQLILGGGGDAKPGKPGARSTSPAVAAAPELPADGEPEQLVSLREATELVAAARAEMAIAEWDSAEAQLMSVNAFEEESGAITLRTTLEERRTLWSQRRAAFDTAVDDGRWLDADTALAQLEQLAKLPPELATTAATVRRNARVLRGAVASATSSRGSTVTTTSKAPATSGGGTSNASSSRAPVTSGGGSGGGSSTHGGSTNSMAVSSAGSGTTSTGGARPQAASGSSSGSSATTSSSSTSTTSSTSAGTGPATISLTDLPPDVQAMLDGADDATIAQVVALMESGQLGL